MKTTAIRLALLLCVCSAPLQAQDIWRCSTDGRSSYGTTPCSDGRLVAINGARTAADVQAAQAVATREAALADQLRQDRLQQQARAQATSSATRARPAPPLKPAATAAIPKAKAKASKHRVAIAGTSPAAAQAIRRTTG